MELRTICHVNVIAIVTDVGLDTYYMYFVINFI